MQKMRAGSAQMGDKRRTIDYALLPDRKSPPPFTERGTAVQVSGGSPSDVERCESTPLFRMNRRYGFEKKLQQQGVSLAFLLESTVSGATNGAFPRLPHNSIS